MNPNIWGPYFWFILHIISFNYPKNPTQFDKDSYTNFFTSIKDILPCEDCKRHYAKNLQIYPITPNLDTKKNMINWLIKIHNQVNVSLGKPTFTTTEVFEIYKNIKPISPFIYYDQVKMEENIKKKFTRKKIISNKFMYIIVVILVIIILILKFQYNKNYYNYN